MSSKKDGYNRLDKSKFKIAIEFANKMFEIFKIASAVRDFLDKNNLPNTHKETIILSITEYFKTNEPFHLKLALSTFDKTCLTNPTIDKNVFRGILGLPPDPDLAKAKTSAHRKQSSVSQEFALGDDRPNHENIDPKSNMNTKPAFSDNDYLAVHERIQIEKQESIQYFKNAVESGDLDGFIQLGNDALEQLSAGISTLSPKDADKVEMVVAVVKDTINAHVPDTFPTPTNDRKPRRKTV